MKGVFALLALATVALASNLEERWDKTSTKIVHTTTTVCPATTTKYQGGHTKVETYLVTSTIVFTEYKKSETTLYLPDVTKSVPSLVYTTYTSPCAVTTTKTVGGKEVIVTYTEISTIIEQVKTTDTAYTTLAPVTKYETAKVFQTEVVSVVHYTTVSAHSTIVVTESLTSTVDVTLYYTVTATLEPPTTKATVLIPVTEISSAAVTEVITIPSEKTLTTQGTVQSVVSYTVIQTSVAPPPTTTIPPTTIISSVPVAASTNTTSTAPAQFTGGAASEKRVGNAAAFAGAGVLAFLAMV